MNIVVLVGIFITLVTGIPVAMQLRGHPRGLVILFFAEMWERFSYYGMRSILIFYLTEQFLFSDYFSQGQYAAYTTLVYLTPLLGGYLADRYLGTRKAVAFGALLLVAGHFTMAIEGKPAVQTLSYGNKTYEFHTSGLMADRRVCLPIGTGCYPVTAAKDGGISIIGLPSTAALPNVLAKGSYTLSVRGRDRFYVNVFYAALALIVMGVGFMKSNISSIVGQLYPLGDLRRDPAFSLFYYGIYIGSFWASALCALIGQTLGWWAGFGLAGVGMLAGLVVFVWGKPLLEGHGEPPDPVALKRLVLGPIDLEAALYVLGLAGVTALWWMVQQLGAMGWVQVIAWTAVLGYLAWHIAKLDRVARDRMILAIILIVVSIAFWTLYEQAGSSLNQFAERNTALPHSGILTITPGQTQTFTSGFILIFAPLLAFAWAKLARLNLDPNPAIKFGLALVQVGLGFLLLVLGARFHDAAFRVPVIFLAGTYLLHATGELCLSPVGLSEMTKLAPAAFLSTIMAVWFLAASAAQYLAGLVAKLTASETVAGQVLDPGKALATYSTTFWTIGWVGVAIGVGLLGASPWLKRLIHVERRDEAPSK